MNKEKLVDLGEQILSDIDIEMNQELREILEQALAKRLYKVFYDAQIWIGTIDKKRCTDQQKESYDKVKPVLDDCLDRVLGKPDAEKANEV